MLKHPYDKMSDEELANKYETVGDFPRKAVHIVPDMECVRYYKSSTSWSQADIMLFKKLYDKRSLSDLSRIFCRTKAAISRMKYRLKLMESKTPEE